MAEEIDSGSLGFNADPVLKAVAAMRQEWDAYNESIIQVAQSQLRFNDSGQLVGVTIRGIADSFDKFSASLKQTDEGLKLVSLSTKTAEAQIEAMTARMEAEADAFSKAQAQMLDARVKGELNQEQSERDEAEHRTKVVAEQEKLREQLQAQHLDEIRQRTENRLKIRRILEQGAEDQAQVAAAEMERRRRVLAEQQALADRLLANEVENNRRQLAERRAQQARIADLINQNAYNAGVASQYRGQLAGQINFRAGTPEQIQSINAALDQLTNHIRNGEVSATRLGQVMRAVATGSAENFQGMERDVANSVIRLRGAVGQLADSHAEFGKVAVEANKQIVISWQTIARFVQYHLLYQAFQAYISGARDAVRAAEELQIKIAEIKTVSQDAQQSTAAWTSQVRQLSDQFGRPEAEVAEGLYQALSNQIAKGAQATQFMTEAMRFGATTVATTDEAVNLLSSAINAYGFQATDAERLSAIFFKTIELGRVRAGEMANTIGRILPLAHAMGVTFEEANAAVATLTISGVRYNEAFTLINNLMSELAKPSKGMQELFKAWGVESGEAAIKTFGFVGVLKRIEAATGDASGEIAKLFPNLRGLRAELGLSGSAFERFQETLQKITDESLPTYRKGTEEVLKNTGKLYEIELTKVKNYFTHDFGDPVIEVVLRVSKALGEDGLVGAIRLVQKWVITAGAAWVGYNIAQRALRLELVQNLSVIAQSNTKISELPGLLTQAGLSGRAFGATLRSALESLVTPANIVTGIIAGIAYYWSEVHEAAVNAEHSLVNELNRLEPIYKKQLDATNERIDGETRIIEAGLKKQFQIRTQYIANIQAYLTQVEEAQRLVIKGALDEVRAATENQLEILRKGVTELDHLSQRAMENIKTAQKMIDELHSKAENRTFEFDVEFGDPTKKAQLVAERIAALRQELTQLTAGSVTPEQGAENLSLVKEKTAEITRLLTDQAREHAKLDKERLTIEQRITELKEKNEGREKIRVDTEAVRKTQDEIAKLLAEQPAAPKKRQTELQKELAEKKALLKEQLRGERDTLADTRDTEQRRRDAEELADLQKKIAGITAQESALPDLIALKREVAELDKQETDQLKQFIDLQKQQAEAAKAAAAEQRKQLDQIKEYFKELTEFKLPKELKTPEDAQKALGQFDAILGKINATGIATDQNAYLRILELRKQLAIQANEEVEAHQIEGRRAAEEKLHAELLKQQQDVANGLKANEAERIKGIEQLRAELKEIDDTASKLGRRAYVPQLDKQLVEAAALLKDFQDSRDPQALIKVQQAFGAIEQSMLRIAQANNIFRQATPRDIVTREGTLQEPESRTYENVSADVSKTILDLVKNVLPQSDQLQQNQRSVESALTRIGVSLTEQKQQTETVTRTLTRYGTTFTVEIGNTTTALKQLDDSIRQTAERIRQIPIPSAIPSAPTSTSTNGPVSTNITIGPGAVQVNVPTGTSTGQIDAVAIGNAINDAIRRGQLELRSGNG